MNGLEVVFRVPLHEVVMGHDEHGDAISGVSPGGAIFFFGCLQSHDLTRNTLILRRDYKFRIFGPSGKRCIVFYSSKSKYPQMFLQRDLVSRIKDLATGTILYPPPACPPRPNRRHKPQ